MAHVPITSHAENHARIKCGLTRWDTYLGRWVWARRCPCNVACTRPAYAPAMPAPSAVSLRDVSSPWLPPLEAQCNSLASRALVHNVVAVSCLASSLNRPIQSRALHSYTLCLDASCNCYAGLHVCRAAFSVNSCYGSLVVRVKLGADSTAHRQRTRMDAAGVHRERCPGFGLHS